MANLWGFQEVSIKWLMIGKKRLPYMANDNDYTTQYNRNDHHPVGESRS